MQGRVRKRREYHVDMISMHYSRTAKCGSEEQSAVDGEISKTVWKYGGIILLFEGGILLWQKNKKMLK